MPANTQSESTHSGPAWKADLWAGVTSGILSVPQGLAFALLAHVPIECGLYAMVVPTFVSALIRSSPFLTTGATNTSALVLGAILGAYDLAPQEVVPLMALITLWMGSIQALFGVLRLGEYGRYVSQAVLVGFSSGAACLIIAGQIRVAAGVPAESSVRFIDTLRTLFENIGHASPYALGLSALTILIVWSCARISRLVPGALIAVVATSLMVWLGGWADGDSPRVEVLDQVKSAWPLFTLPDFHSPHATDVLSPALALAVLGMVEAISIGKAVSAKGHVRFHPNQELLAKGVGNIAGAFFGCMPSSASWTRSAVHLQMGSRTRWSGVIAGLTVLALVLVFARWTHYIPKPCLGALIIWIAAHMLDFRAAKYVWRWGRSDALVLGLTFASMLLIEVQYAIYLGIFMSLILLVRRVGELHLVELTQAGPERFRELELDEKSGSFTITLLQLEGELFFGIVDKLEERLEGIAARGARVIVLRMKHATHIDASASEALAQFGAHFRERGGRLILCGLKPAVFEQISRAHLGEVLGPDNLVCTHPHPFESVRQALARARAELAGTKTEPLIRTASESADGTAFYEI